MTPSVLLSSSFAQEQYITLPAHQLVSMPGTYMLQVSVACGQHEAVRFSTRQYSSWAELPPLSLCVCLPPSVFLPLLPLFIFCPCPSCHCHGPLPLRSPPPPQIINEYGSPQYYLSADITAATTLVNAGCRAAIKQIVEDCCPVTHGLVCNT